MLYPPLVTKRRFCSCPYDINNRYSRNSLSFISFCHVYEDNSSLTQNLWNVEFSSHRTHKMGGTRTKTKNEKTNVHSQSYPFLMDLMSENYQQHDDKTKVTSSLCQHSCLDPALQTKTPLIFPLVLSRP